MADYRIWKFPLVLADEQVIGIPDNWIKHVLSVDEQNGELMLWVLAKPGPKTARLRVRIIGTGHPCESMSEWFFTGTVQTQAGFVWHGFHCLLE